MRAGKRLAALVTLSAAYLGLVALGAGGAAAAGDKAKDEGKKGKTVTVRDKDKDSVVRLAPGGTLEVRLASNRTTGFSWQVSKIAKDQLKTQGKPEYLRPQKPRPGASGVEVFRFVAEAPGKSELELVYRRPFEKDKPPAKTFKVSVEIK